jgi:hypothetical protein
MLVTILIAPSVLAFGVLFFIQNWAEMRGGNSNL